MSECDPAIDRALMRLATRGPLAARMADAYASIFARSGLLRRKLVLLVAILESHGETSRAIDTARPGSRIAWFGELAFRAALTVALLLAAALILVPARFRRS
jgi:hypothetical protein